MGGPRERSRHNESLRAIWSGNRISLEAIFLHMSRQDLGTTQPPLQWVPGIFSGDKTAGTQR